jgi:hypothetical protein
MHSVVASREQRRRDRPRRRQPWPRIIHAQPVSPYLTVSDGKAAIDFYKRAFGAVEVGVMEAEDKKRIMHAALSINGGIVMLSDEFPEYASMDGTQAPRLLAARPSPSISMSPRSMRPSSAPSMPVRRW